MDMKFQNNLYVKSAEADIKQVFDLYKHPKSLDYRIHPCILPFGPAFGCSNSIQLNLVRFANPGYTLFIIHYSLFIIHCLFSLSFLTVFLVLTAI